MRTKFVIAQRLFLLGTFGLLSLTAFGQEEPPTTAELLQALKLSNEAVVKAAAGIEKAVAAATAAANAATEAAQAASEAAAQASKAARPAPSAVGSQAAATAERLPQVSDVNGADFDDEEEFVDEDEEDDEASEAAARALLNPPAEDDAASEAAALELINPPSAGGTAQGAGGVAAQGAAATALPAVPGDLGFKKWLTEKRAHFRIPEYDQAPDETATEFQQMYKTLVTQVKKLVGQDLGSAQDVVNRVVALHKALVNPILDARPGRRLDWEPLFLDLQPQLQDLINKDLFDPANLRYYLKMYEELEESFGELAKVLEKLRDLSEAERAAMGQGGGGGGSSAAAASSGRAYSFGAGWHAHRMTHIIRHHQRRMAWIQGY